MDFPADFRCPISMELMKDPVTISTGVTYERKSIEKWLFVYKKQTCPNTMQPIDINSKDFHITPNHTLKRLILAWHQTNQSSSPPPPFSSTKHDELVSILKTLESTPFKVSLLKKLNSLILEKATGNNDHQNVEVKLDFIRSGGVETLLQIIVQILVESDFVAFRASEEALSVLCQLQKDVVYYADEDDDEGFGLLWSKPEFMKAMAIMVQRGSAEARSDAVSIFRKVAKRGGYDWNSFLQQDHQQGMNLFKSLLELLSDENTSSSSSSSSRSSSSCAVLEVMIEILTSSSSLKKIRLFAIEAGGICTLVELLPDSTNQSKCEKMLYLIKIMCECAEGRLSMVEHGLGIAVVSKKMLRVSETATKICVKILSLVSSFHPTDRVVEEMLVFGAVKKMLALFLCDGGGGGGRRSPSTKEKVVKMFKLHGDSWSRYPCFSIALKDYLGLAKD